MLSPGFIDLLLLIILLVFTLKGYITGFIRSVVTIVAVFIALGLCTAMPTIASPVLGYSIHADAPNYMVINRLVSFTIFFAIVQAVGFLATGLLEKIGLGTADKAVGGLLGIVTGVVVGCLPAVAIHQSAVAYYYQPNQRLLKSSVMMKAYAPLVKGIAKPPRKPKPKSAHG